MANNNPWKGLNFYVETDIIYGRDVEIDSLSHYIFNNTQTVLYGRSGIGKSSILNAGIFPKARPLGMIPVTVRLKHSGEQTYLQQIKEALDAGGIAIREVVPVIDAKSESLWEFMHRSSFVNARTGEEVVPLLVFDQFEEIFTLQRSEKVRKQFFNELADLFNDIKPLYIVEHENSDFEARTERASKSINTGTFKGLTLSLNLSSSKTNNDTEEHHEYILTPNYHIVFALREDFLSSLEMYSYNIPVMRNNRFPLQPINDEQAAEIIMLPRPGLVDKEVAKLIIRKVTGEENFEIDGVPEIQVDSAILSLYLSSLYDKMVAAGETKFTTELVEAHSDNIIEDFYAGAVKGLPEKSVEWLEDTLINDDGRRDNRDKSTVLRESGLTEEQYDNLVYNAKLLRQFSYGGDLRVEFIHDVLCPVIVGRKNKRAEEDRVRRIEQAAREQKRRARRNRNWIVASFLILAAIWGGILGWTYYQNEMEVAEYYTGFTLENGWPQGDGHKLGEGERARTPLYYKLSKKGHATEHFTDIEICSSNTMLPAGGRIPWPEFSRLDEVADSAMNRINSSVRYLRFTGTDSSDQGAGPESAKSQTQIISKTELLDKDKNILLTLSYFHTKNGEAWIQYLSPKGNSQTIRENGIDRSLVTWDDHGRLTSQRFFTSAGDVQPLDTTTKVAGFAWEYPADSEKVTYYLNCFGQPNGPTAQLKYNRKSVTLRGDTTITAFARVISIFDEYPQDAEGDHGFARIVSIGDVDQLYLPDSKKVDGRSIIRRDKNGNPVMQRIEGRSSSSLAPLITWSYKGDTGLMTEKRYMNADKSPFGSPSDIWLWQWDYDKSGNLTKEIHKAKDNVIQYSYTKATKTQNDKTISTETLIDRRAGEDLITTDTISADGSYHSRAFYSGNHPVNLPVRYGNGKVDCHLFICKKQPLTSKSDNGVETVTTYYVSASDDKVLPLPTGVDDLGLKAGFRRTERRDSEGNITFLQITDYAGGILTRMGYQVQNGQVIGRYVAGILDERPVRCPNWEEEEFAYYTFNFSKNFNDQFTHLKPFDEWQNPSVIRDDTVYIVVRTSNFKGEKLANGGIISFDYTQPMLEDDKVSPIALPYLHILSKESALYKSDLSKLTDGDRIIALGSWKYGDAPALLKSEWSKLSDPAKSVKITILRPGGKNGVFERKTVTIQGDAAEASRSEYHIMNLSFTEAGIIKPYL